MNIAASSAEVTGVQLVVESVSKRFGGVTAVETVSIDVPKGRILSIIGPNGAGKTSIFNVLSGVYRPVAGQVRFDGQDLLHHRRHEIAHLGVARVFQGLGLFPSLTVLENLLLGRHHRMATGILRAGFYLGPAARAEGAARAWCEAVIEFLELERWRKVHAAALPYGIQKRVQLGRALAMEPKLILLDEPIAGMNLQETEEMARFILDIKEEYHVAQILVEHDMGVVMDIADRVLALDFGRVIAEGKPTEVQRNADVIKAYLGEEHQVAEAGSG
jgi:branched-chain amino acid transport system ATP-binding protein